MAGRYGAQPTNTPSVTNSPVVTPAPTNTGRGRYTGGTPVTTTPSAPVGLFEYITKRTPQFAKAGGQELLANFIEVLASSAEFPSLNMLVPGEKEKAQGRASSIRSVSEPLYKEASETKAKANEGLTGLQKLVGVGVEALPSIAATAVIPGAKAAGLVNKLIAGARMNVLQGQLMFNPDDVEGGDTLKNRTVQGTFDAIVSGAMELGLKGAKNFVLKPIFNLSKDVTNKVFSRVGTRVIENAADMADSGVKQVLDNDVAKISKQDFVDILKGNKPIDDNTRAFFSSDEWKNLAKKYGTTYEGYPDYLEVSSPRQTAEMIKAQGISGYLDEPTVVPTSDLKELVVDAAEKVSRLDDEGATETGKIISEYIDAFVNDYSYKIDKKAIANLVLDTANNIREFDDFNASVMAREVKKAMMDGIDRAGATQEVVYLKRISNLVGSRVSDPLSVLNSYDRWASKNGAMKWDEVAQALNENGFEIDTQSPTDLIDFAKKIPTKKDLLVVPTPPKEIDIDTAINNAVQTSAKQVESPFVAFKESVPVDVPTTTTDKLIQNLPEDIAKKVDSGEALIDTSSIDVDNMEKPTLTERVQDVTRKATRIFPYSFESDVVETYGKFGKELVARGRRAIYKSLGAKDELIKANQDMGLKLLTPEELLNVRQIVEGKAAPLNERTAKVSQQLRYLFGEWADKTQVEEKITNYYPRYLNEEGKEAFSHATDSSEIVSEIAKEKGITKNEALNILKNSVKRSQRKGAFEFPRVLQDLPDKYRMNPLDEILSWENEASRRFGVIDEFGKNAEIARKLVSDMALQGKSLKEQIHISNIGEEYLNKIIGKSGNYTDLSKVFSFLKQSMVSSKLSPLTTVANEMQGFVNSYLDNGWRGVWDANNKANDTLLKGIGIDNLRGKIGDEFKASDFAEKWLNWIGMEASEKRGILRSARASFSAINRAFELLKKNPSDIKAQSFLNDYGMFVDEGSLEKALKTGAIPELEMRMGVLEGSRKKMFFQVPGERPSWATTQAGSVAYVFHNYMLSQLRLLRDAPLDRKLIYVMLLAPLTGTSVMLLRNAISGRENPKTFGEWFVKASTAGAVTPIDVIQATQNDSRLLNYLAGGYSPLVDVITGQNVAKTAVKNFAPGGSLLWNMLFGDKK